MTHADLADYIATNLQDPISRPSGVGDFMLFGSQYAMRIWLDPERLNSFQLPTADVANAIRRQTVQVSSVQFGGLPANPCVKLGSSVNRKPLLHPPEPFENLLPNLTPE